MLTRILITAILSIQLTVFVHSSTVEKCLSGQDKAFPSPGGPGFATCFPWQNRSCCSAETTMELKENGLKNMFHFDWDYCGGLSEPCKKQFIREECFYFCDPNVIKWRVSGDYSAGLPFCSDTCDTLFEACKNDKTYSENWIDYYILYRKDTKGGPIKPNGSCRTFAEIFQNSEGLCNKIYGPIYKYERSSNCLVFDFEGENPNDKVVPGPPPS